MKTIIIATFIAVLAVLSGVIAYRLSADALAIIIGVVIGVVAIVPSLLMSFLMVRRQQVRDDEQFRAVQPQAQPPVVVVSGGFPAHMLSPQAMPQPQPQGLIPPRPPAAQQREFRMMGYESTEAVELQQDEWSSL